MKNQRIHQELPTLIIVLWIVFLTFFVLDLAIQMVESV